MIDELTVHVRYFDWVRIKLILRSVAISCNIVTREILFSNFQQFEFQDKFPLFN